MEASVYVTDELKQCETVRERTARVKELAAYYNVSISTIWRWAKDRGYSARGERMDKGSTDISDELLEKIAARVLVGKRVAGKFTAGVKTVCKQLEAEGYDIPVGVARVCALLRERGMDKDSLAQLPPHLQLISNHPNHVWQFDITNCLQYYFAKGRKKGMSERDIESELYKNKVMHAILSLKDKRQLLRFVIADHCSGSFFMWYYYATGERAEDGADFFYKAFTDKRSVIADRLGLDGCKYNMHGVPFILMADKGSILRNKTIINLMENLKVDVKLHAAGNPQAKGLVEGLMNVIDREFESILKIHSPAGLDELNQWSLAWCIKFNEQATFRRSKKRADLWRMIKHEELRLCPPLEVYAKLIHKNEEYRPVNGNCQLSYGGNTYSVPYTDWARQKVLVKANAYEYPAVDIHFNGLVYTALPDTKDEYGRTINSHFSTTIGEYHAMPETMAQKTKKQLEKIAEESYGVIYTGNAQKRYAKPAKPKDEIMESVPTALRPDTPDEKIVFIQPEGVMIDTPDIHKPLTKEPDMKYRITPVNIERTITVTELIQRMVRIVGKMSVEQNKAIKARYKDGISLTEADSIVNKLCEDITLDEIIRVG